VRFRTRLGPLLADAQCQGQLCQAIWHRQCLRKFNGRCCSLPLLRSRPFRFLDRCGAAELVAGLRRVHQHRRAGVSKPSAALARSYAGHRCLCCRQCANNTPLTLGSPHTRPNKNGTTPHERSLQEDLWNLPDAMASTLPNPKGPPHSLPNVGAAISTRHRSGMPPSAFTQLAQRPPRLQTKRRPPHRIPKAGAAHTKAPPC